MADGPKISVALTGVPETLLWTLHFRALEAARPDALLRDPMAVELVRRIDYPFTERLGAGSGRAQWQALRSRTFDRVVEAFTVAHPGGTVIALGEGLETQFWRVDDGRLHWVGVDLPEAAQIRRLALPANQRRHQIEASVLDDGWEEGLADLPGVEESRGVLLTAQGLLMYLTRDQVHGLLTRLARRFPGAELVFDGVPRWTSAVTQRVSGHGRGMPVPPMPWAMDGREAAALRKLPGVRGVRRLHPPRGRGPLFGVALPVVDRVPVLRALVLGVWILALEDAQSPASNASSFS